MKNSITLLIFLIIFSAIIMFICYVIWLNRASDKTWLIFGKAIALPVLLGAGMLAYELLLVPLPDDVDEINVLIIHNDKFEITDIDKVIWHSHKSYGLGYLHLSRNLKILKEGAKINLNNIKDIDQDNIYLDLIEATLLKWFMQNYHKYWKKERRTFKGFGGLAVSWKPFKYSDQEVFNPSDIDKYVLKWPEIAKKFSQNVFIKDEPIHPFNEISFPPYSEINEIRGKWKRGIRVLSKCIELNIIINPGFGGGSLSPSIIGEVGNKISKIFSPTPTYMSLFIITVKCKYTPWRRGSPSIADQKEWVHNLILNLKEDFEWSLIQNEFFNYIGDNSVSESQKTN